MTTSTVIIKCSKKSVDVTSFYCYFCLGCAVQLQPDQPAQPDGRPDRSLLRLHHRHLRHQRRRPRRHPDRRAHVHGLHRHGQVRDGPRLRRVSGQECKYLDIYIHLKILNSAGQNKIR